MSYYKTEVGPAFLKLLWGYHCEFPWMNSPVNLAIAVRVACSRCSINFSVEHLCHVEHLFSVQYLWDGLVVK